MIIGVTGHVGSGKTSFMLRYASSFGREGLFVVAGLNDIPAMEGTDSFRWKVIDVLGAKGKLLPAVLDRINCEANIFRADRRVLVVDSIAGYFAACHHELLADSLITGEMYRHGLEEYRKQLERALFSYQGNIFIISAEPAELTPFMSTNERVYHEQLGAFNRSVGLKCHQWFVMTAGMAVDVKAIQFRGL
ncbi:adenosylcobinamide-phosphate guanylyltransferase [Paenibacillus sp. UMB4589-SE434]|uniref:adenosylcobinamide-phosphate guanylyltransferase n=1 Tax=Paenibacillus sp. UMB4589-SE434 TaxID=3046314 RepID=UPI00254A0187|nr:adenosylcobinamide-phosphate guanylyltransferase [Paenibacillus sp. UMB4589-SE434]MDK8183082.1 adenosylcobinamide-phosphate guanylyltransferase [Paenibacillus sp. UMB4589-SE434]